MNVTTKPTRSRTLTREGIVRECVDAVQACYKHYSNKSLSELEEELVYGALRDRLPARITSTQTKFYRKA